MAWVGAVSRGSGRAGHVGQQLVRDAPQVRLEVAAEHVAQDRAQAAAERGHDRLDVGIGPHEAGDDRRAPSRSRGAARRPARRARPAPRRSRPCAPPSARSRSRRARPAGAGGEQPVRQRLERRCRARSRARSGAAPRPARPTRGVRRATSAQNARSGSSSSGVSRQSPAVRRRPVASGMASHGRAVGARPGGRAERGLGVVPQPQRGLQPAQAAARLLEPAVARRALEREHGDGRVLVAAQLGRRVAQARRRGRASSPLAQRHLARTRSRGRRPA